MFVWTAESPLQTILHSAAMSTNPSFKCTQCHSFKLPEEFGTHQRESNDGQKGDHLTKCLSCTTINSSQQKQKHIEDHLDHSPKRFATQPAVPPSQFVEELSKYTSTSKFDISLHVSLDEVNLTDKDIANYLLSLAWKATGYRFM